jgi:hypothetical protein
MSFLGNKYLILIRPASGNIAFERGPNKAVADGYYIMTNPLLKGNQV